MSIILARLPPQQWSYGSSLACAKQCRLDPSSNSHGVFVDDQGILHYQHIDAAARTSTTLLRFQLQYQAADDVPYEPVSKPWRFEFVPGMPGDVLLVQEGSCRVLYASFPKQDANSSDVFLFGSHTAPVQSIATNGNIVLSGCQQGQLKLWRLSDGQLADSCSTADSSSVTAVTCLGPLLVAAGTSSSAITLYDIASGRLLAVQRLMAGPGTVQCLAAWLPHQVLAAANLAPTGPLPPDGGGVLSGLGTSILRGSDCEGAAEPGTRTVALLAAASSSGWLCVFEAHAADSSTSWSLLHSTGSLIAPGPESAQLAFTQDGGSLAVTSRVAQLLSHEAIAAAAAGGQPGAVSLYQVAVGCSSDNGSALSGLLPPLLLEQQQREQLRELQLWHQWSLSSMPVGLAVLPGSSFSLVRGKQLQPRQVVQLYVVPEVGPGQVLCAEREMARHDDGSIAQDNSSQLLQQPHAAAEAQSPGEAASEIPARSSAAAAAKGPARSLPHHQQQHAQPQPQPQRHPPASSSSSTAASEHSSSKGMAGDWDEAVLLNIAERDLAEVANAIAAAAGPVHDAELSALLADVAAGLQDTAAPDAGPSAAALTAARVEGAATSGRAAASIEPTMLLHEAVVPAAIGLQQHQEQATSLAPASAAAASAAASADASGAGSGPGLRLPQTLPAARSWMGSSAAVAAGLAAPVQEACLDLTALAQELQEEHQRMQQEQQRMQREQQHMQQEQQHVHFRGPALQQQHAGAGGPADASPQSSSPQAGAEQELPCETSFQHLLNQQRGPQQVSRPEQQLQEPQQQETLQQVTRTDIVPSSAAAANLLASTPRARGAAPPAGAPLAAAAAAQTSMPCGVQADGARQVQTGRSDAEPQPRRLPEMLRQVSQDRQGWPATAAVAGAAVNAAAAAPAAASGRPRSSGSSKSRVVPSAMLSSRQAAVAAAHVEATQSSATAEAAAMPDLRHQPQLQQQPQQQQQQQQRVPLQCITSRQQQEQQEQEQGGPLRQSSKLSVQQRLTLRRQQREPPSQQQQQQQQPPSQQHASVPSRGPAAGVAPGKAGTTQVTGSRPLAPTSDHPLASAVQNSSRLLAAKVQEAQQPPDITVDPSAPEVRRLALARLSELDLATDQQQYNYEELPDLRDVATPTHAPKLVPKQVDLQWVASRSLKPRMDTLFKPQEWQQGFVDPQVLVLPSWPTPQQVVQQLLWPGQRPGMWT